MLNEYRVHLHLYGIPNCDSCRGALKWLTARNVPHTFHDIRKEPLTLAQLQEWVGSAHGPYLLNKRSTTWRQLSDPQKAAADNDLAALLLEHPTLIKRPVITDGEAILDIGFAPRNLEDYI